MPLDVETTSAVEDNANATPAQGADSSASPDKSASDPQNSNVGSDQPQGSLTPPNNENVNRTTPTSQQPPNGQQPPAPVNWQEQYKHLQSMTDRKLSQASRERKQFETEFNELRDFRRQQQEQAQRQNLKPWSKLHPENPKFSGLLHRAKAVNAQLRNINPNLPPESQQAAKDAILSALSPDEQTQLEQYREDVSHFQHSFLEDPHGALAPIIQPMIQQAIQSERARIQAEQRVGQDLDSPELKPLVEQHGPEIQKALDDGVPYDYAVHMLKLFGEVEKLRSQQSGLSQKAAMGQEQIRLAQGKAAITRDPAPSRNVDIYAMAKKQAEAKGWSTADPRFLSLLAELEKANSPI